MPQQVCYDNFGGQPACTSRFIFTSLVDLSNGSRIMRIEIDKRLTRIQWINKQQKVRETRITTHRLGRRIGMEGEEVPCGDVWRFCLEEGTNEGMARMGGTGSTGG